MRPGYLAFINDVNANGKDPTRHAYACRVYLYASYQVLKCEAD